MKINYWSHACIQVETDVKILFDPWLLQQPVYNLTTWKYPDLPSEGIEDFIDSDVYVLTHSHEDHFHIPSINLLDRNRLFLIPSFDEISGPRIKLIYNTLKQLGFTNIVELKAWEIFEIADIKIMRIPSALSRRHDWENSSYYIESKNNGMTLLNMNDTVSDETLLNEITRHCKNIDCLMLQAGGVTMFPGLFKMSPSEMKKHANSIKTDLTDQRLQINSLKPKFVVPFAADFCWLDKNHFHCNFTNRSSPREFLVMLDEISYEGKCIILKPNQQWQIGDTSWSGDYADWPERDSNLRKMQDKYKHQLYQINEYIYMPVRQI